ncbi:MAG: putative YggS family pyridoxal phosphate enzyme [Streblomastix strix]|uniref:Pyridoxal phosphate homeostasis protein n=1 Tax=Streblomastix strix TaxID=222440 RepID=A0A5J4X9A0_9EUKA|nr:MAG: putative YggS family pyridoxal phosphate enzyme [Streblomastix strix]
MTTIKPDTIAITQDMITQNLQDVLQSISDCSQLYKHIQQPQLIAVSKTKGVELIIAAYNAGQRNFGENYVQELVQKSKELPIDIDWHFIGHLQSNKIKQLLSVPNLQYIHTIDSIKLAEKIQKCLESEGTRRIIKVLIEVRTSPEESKIGGVEINTNQEDGNQDNIDIRQILELIMYLQNECRNLQFIGLMTVEKPGDYSCFDKLVRLKEILLSCPEVEARDKVLFCKSKDEQIQQEENDKQVEIDLIEDMPGSRIRSKNINLSMGMSDSYQEAIKRGADYLRIGSLIFGERVKKSPKE